jgi:uncharacterized protein with PIN domain
VCRRVFWEGTHWQRMRALMDSVASERASPVETPFHPAGPRP